MTPASPDRAQLRRDLLAYVERPEPERFDALARRVVAFQAAAVPAYGRLVEARGGLPEDWRRAPRVPTELFRELDLCAAPADGRDEAVFRTSGTTGARRGARRVPDLGLYHAAMEGPFVRHVLAGDRTPRPWVSLIPRRADLPDSSLSHMVDGLAERLADAARSTWAMTPDGLDAPAARAALEAHAAEGRPVVVLATAFAVVQLLDAEPGWHVALPAGSRMMLTGGFKGRSREVSEAELLAELERRLGLAAEAVVAEYGMTELTSQAYGRPLEPPPWLALRIVDPTGERERPPGEEGRIACFDLLNLDNVSAILTGDLGIADEAGRVTLRGRAPDADLRGCSLTAEELAS